ncbi:MAG: acetyl-CoA carboxylase carboxyl transferase subunit alpha, partial [Clostridia bacterium]|nr:acetyl-CoA carboxylase carboxyl transferase subunit alpha [Clostridia bacterium]
ASILWKDPAKAADAAASLKLTEEDAKSLGVIERILSEKEMGKKEFYDRLRALLCEELSLLMNDSDLVSKRYDRFREIGVSAVVKEKL